MNLMSLHTFSPKLLKFYIFIIYIDRWKKKNPLCIANKRVVIYAFLVCKFFGLKIWLCTIFDKF